MAINNEEIRTRGKDILKTVKKLIKKGNVSRVIIKDKEGNKILNIPVTVGVLGAIWAPALAGFAFMFGLIKECTITIEKKK